MKILIKNANIITPYEIKRDASLIIENGRIEDLVAGPVKEEGFQQVLDLEGKYLAPGFIDIHNHGNFGYDAMDASYQALDSIGSFHASRGVSSYLITTMTQDPSQIKRTLEVAGNYINDRGTDWQSGAQALGIYLEGPYFSMEKKGAQPPEFIKNPSIDEITDFIQVAKNHIRIVAVAPELEGSKDFIKFVKEQGIVLTAAHSNATFEETKTGIDAGIGLATHLYNGMREFNHREPGIIGAVLTDERVVCEIICDGIHLHPVAMDLALRAKGRDGLVLISDAMRAAGLEDGQYELGGQPVFVEDGAARLKEGSLAGSTLTLDRAVANMIELVNVKLEDAVRMASLNPARLIGVDGRKGSIEVGKDADLVVFDQDIRIEKTLVKGQLVFDKADKNRYEAGLGGN